VVAGQFEFFPNVSRTKKIQTDPLPEMQSIRGTAEMERESHGLLMAAGTSVLLSGPLISVVLQGSGRLARRSVTWWFPVAVDPRA
jgi:hypothetical protein